MNSKLDGFYFDPVRKKYFKVLPNHIASKGVKYSKSAIKEQEDNHKAQELESREARSNTQIKPSPVLLHPLFGVSGVRREIGELNRFAVADAMNATWTWGLKENKIFTSMRLSLGSRADIVAFSRDSATDAFVYGLSGESLGHHAIYAYRAGSVMNNRVEIDFTLQSKVTSMSMSPSRTFISTTFGGPEPARSYLTTLPDPIEFERLMNGKTMTANTKKFSLEGSKHQIQWSSAAKPDATSAAFAVGASNQVAFIEEGQGEWLRTLVNHVDLDAFSIDWLSRDVVISGHASGEVVLWDLRSRGMASRFKFHAPINHSKRLNEHHIVVSGKAESINIYDLRYFADPENMDPSIPIMSFPTFKKFNYTSSNGFAVSGNLIAAANRDSQIQLFDARRGRELQIGREKPFPRLGFSVSCLEFGEATDGSGLRLYGSVDCHLVEWSWAG